MITAALPDPSQPTFVVLAAAFGAFVGASVARVHGAERDDLRRSAETGPTSSPPSHSRVISPLSP
jgi:hypothetical protein